ncbi:helix-turn-helix domain-containing protein [Streptomyces sp. NPDC026672]|uniref:AraC-like ligand-binding domain-containing protein n=1 Tax=unclassified Streptomyces TaxID=2593676 RepID=UPI0033C1F491
MHGSVPSGSLAVRSTAVVEEDRAFEYWRELICDTFVQLSLSPTRDESFAGRITHADLSTFEISTVRAGGQRVRRTSRLIARDGGEYLLAGIQTHGRGRIEQDGRVVEIEQGSMALFDSTRPYTLHFDDAFEQIVVQFPLRDLLVESGLRDVGDLTARRLTADTHAGVVAQYFHGLSRVYEADPRAGMALAAHGRSLMASSLALSTGRSGQGGTGTTGALARERVMAFLRAHHTDPGLSVDDVARACTISRRALYRLFEASPGGIVTLLRRIRVDHARALLHADPARSLESIALACGFGGERQFYRVFRQETGTTPGEFRASGTIRQ